MQHVPLLKCRSDKDGLQPMTLPISAQLKLWPILPTIPVKLTLIHPNPKPTSVAGPGCMHRFA